MKIKSNIINLPSFVYQIYEIEKANLIKKLLIIIIGKVSQIIIKHLNKSFVLIKVQDRFKIKLRLN